MDLPHRAPEQQAVAVVVLAELGVAPGRLAWVSLDVFLPQQAQRHALAAHLVVHLAIVGGHVMAGAVSAACQQPALQRGLAERGHHRPVQSAGSRQRAVLGDHALGKAQRCGNALVRELSLKLQTKNVLDLAHVDPRCGHAFSGQKPARLPAWVDLLAQHHHAAIRHRCAIVTDDSAIVTEIPVTARNRPRSTETTGHVRPESSATFLRNRRSRCSAIRSSRPTGRNWR